MEHHPRVAVAAGVPWARMPRTQAERSEATTQQLTEAARRLFGERGYAATSVEDIVRRAGVTRGALYHHFETKVDVFRAVVEGQQAELARRLDEAAAAAPADAWGRLRVGCHAFVDACLDPEVRQVSLLDGPAVLGWAGLRAIEDRHTIALLRRGLRAAARAGRVRPGDLDVRTYVVHGALCEGGVLIARAADPGATAEHVKAEVDLLLDGLATRST